MEINYQTHPKKYRGRFIPHGAFVIVQHIADRKTGLLPADQPIL